MILFHPFRPGGTDNDSFIVQPKNAYTKSVVL